MSIFLEQVEIVVVDAWRAEELNKALENARSAYVLLAKLNERWHPEFMANLNPLVSRLRRFLSFKFPIHNQQGQKLGEEVRVVLRDAVVWKGEPPIPYVRWRPHAVESGHFTYHYVEWGGRPVEEVNCHTFKQYPIVEEKR